MIEQKWHKHVREEFIKELKNSQFKVYSSHSEGKLELFRGEAKSQNFLSDADIAVLDHRDKRIIKIIEIERNINPKKIIGIVLTTHLCDYCRIRIKDKKKDYSLENISLTVIYKKVKEKSKTVLKLAAIKKALDDIIKKTKGCLSEFDWEEHE